MPPEELTSAEEAEQIRNSAESKEAEETAETAEETSEEAEETAEEALETAEEAEETAEEAEETSQEALDLAREANELSHRAVGIAEQTQAAVTEIADLLHQAIVEEVLEENHENEEVNNAPAGKENNSKSSGSGSDIRADESEKRRRAGYSGRLGGRRRR